MPTVLARPRPTAAELRSRARSRLASTVTALLPGPDADAAPGPLDAQDRAAVQAVAATLLAGTDVDLAPYVDALAARAELVPGHRDLVARFRAAADAQARRRRGAAFADSDLATRQEVLARASRARVHVASTRQRLRGLRDRDWSAYHRWVVRPVLVQYAATDAWTAVGYPQAPGRPRGLDGHDRPLRPTGRGTGQDAERDAGGGDA